MSTFDINQLRDIWGGWSTLAAMAGLFGALVSFLSRYPRLLSAKNGDAIQVIAALPWLMGLFAVFIGVFVLAASEGYSGPVPSGLREVRHYDIRLAAVIAFAFGFVFAFDTLRFSKLRTQPATWLCIGVYAFIGFVVMNNLLSHSHENAA
ncbi:MAG: hypothetical protein JWM68_2758 [Verrucomicrobiales bacterium]|nr:hypothetical protein [Verrucomicrobiales bacterium]